MVHKSQEALAREVLSEYPWFNKSRHNPDAIDIKAVRPVSDFPGYLTLLTLGQENLDFNPAKDDLRNEATWETQSIASTQMLDGKSELDHASMRNSPDINAYLERGTMSRQNSAAFGDVPLESSDNLLQREYEAYVMDERPKRQPSVARYNQRAVADDHIAVHPLLERQDSNWSQRDQSHYDGQSAYDQTPYDAPYPPTSFNFHPNGYTPPPMSRTESQSSRGSQDRTHGLR